MMAAGGSNGWAWAFSVILCGMGAAAGLAYLWMARHGSAQEGVWRRESEAAYARRVRRRRLGAALLAAVSVGFLAGTGWLDPHLAPLVYIIYWFLILVMLAWLVGLGLLDLLQTRRMFRKPLGDDRGKRD